MAINTSRATLRQALGLKFAGEMYVSGTVLASPASTTTTFALAELVDSGADVKKYVDRWVYLPASGQERRITAYNPTNGQVTVQRPLSGAPTAGTAVEVHRWSPTIMHDAINRALYRCKYRDTLQITPVSGQTQYSLAAFTYPENPKDILGVWLYDPPAVGQGIPRDIPWYRVQDVGGTLYLYINPPSVLYSGSEIRVEIQRPYVSLTLDASTTNAPAEWVLAGAEVEMYNTLIERTGPGRERDRLVSDRALADRRFKSHSRQNQANYPRKVNMSAPVWGVNAVV